MKHSSPAAASSAHTSSSITSIAGFTLIEVMTVILISAVLAGIAVGYSHVGENQIALSVESTKISELALQAKALAIATYSHSSGACAYGFSVNYAAQTYSIFKFVPGTPICPSIASTTASGITSAQMVMYEYSSWNVHVSTGVQLVNSAGNANTLSAVLFYPPNPTTMISYASATSTLTIPAGPAQIYLATVDNSAQASVTVGVDGQVDN